MQLAIVRHGLAGQHGDLRYPDDGLRPLTEKGVRQFRKVAKKLMRRGFAPHVVATSPLVRCRQTAELLCQRVVPPPELVELTALEPGSDLATLVEWSNQQGCEVLAWVGHAPDVEHLTAVLIGAQPDSLLFAKGAVALIEFDDAIVAGQGQLRWMLTPAMLGC